MKTHSWAALALLALLALLAGAGTLAAAPALKRDRANLLVNGSFEDGPAFKVHKPLDQDSAEIPRWVVTRGQIDVVEEHDGTWKAAAGRRSLDLHGSPGHGGVKQAFATRPGRKYRVTFALSGNPGAGHEKVQLAVEAAGQAKKFECDLAGKTNEDLKWERRAWEFKATEKTTVLEFRTAMPPTSNGLGGPAIDDVKVVEVD